MRDPSVALRPGDRALYPDLAARAYLHWAGIAPPSLLVRAAVSAALDDHARHGAAAYATYEVQRNRLRADLAALIGAEADEIAFVPNTTEAALDIALSLPWKRGERVLLFDGEFPANVAPWQRAAALFDLDVRFVSLAPFARSIEEGLQVLERELAQGARLLAVSLVQFTTGLRMPVEAMAELCHRYGAEIFVDGIQGLGALPLSVRDGIDYLGCGGHKWLMGISGAGFLFVDRRRAAALRETMCGWSSHPRALDFLVRGPGHLRYDLPIPRTAASLERGSPNTVGYAALAASVGALRTFGVDRVLAHVSAYLDRLEPELVARGFVSARSADPRARSGILGLEPPTGVDPVRLQSALASQGIVCGLPNGWLRFAPHVPNSLHEIPIVTAAVDEALRNVRP